MSDFTLEDARSQTWRKVKKHVEDALAAHRANLEGDIPPEKSRGAILALKGVLALEAPEPPVDEDE